jgi:hypothetical protein
MPPRSPCCHSSCWASADWELGLGLPITLGVLAGNMLVPEFLLKSQAGALVRLVIHAVRAQLHGAHVGARPDDMDMLAPVLFVHHDGAGLALQAKLFFQHLDRPQPLVAGHFVFGVGVDVGVIEAEPALGALGDQVCQSRKASCTVVPAPSPVRRSSTRSLVSARPR